MVSETLKPVVSEFYCTWQTAKGESLPPPDGVGEFTDNIIQSKQDDKLYFMRMVVLRMNNEFNLLPAPGNSDISCGL